MQWVDPVCPSCKCELNFVRYGVNSLGLVIRAVCPKCCEVTDLTYRYASIVEKCTELAVSEICEQRQPVTEQALEEMEVKGGVQ